jgi:hypothetical protein
MMAASVLSRSRVERASRVPRTCGITGILLSSFCED